MKSKRTGHGVVYLNGKIYSVGGRTNILNLNILEAFEIKNKIWTSKAPMKNINANFGVSVQWLIYFYKLTFANRANIFIDFFFNFIYIFQL